MPSLRGALDLLLRLLRALVFGWAAGLAWILAMLRLLWKRLMAQFALSERDRRRTDERCVAVRHPSLRKPDPLVYSQGYLMKLGLAVTWDNPDIQLYRAGAPVSSADLQPGTLYDVVTRIWNSATDAPVVGLPVRVTVHGFGIGTTGSHVGDTTVNLGVKGGPGTPAFATVQWTTPSTPGHYCLQAHLDWADDANSNNNLGQENTNVVATASPATTAFKLRNDHAERTRRYHFEVDGYHIPEQVPCVQIPDRRPRDRGQGEIRVRDAAAVGLVEVPEEVIARHGRRAHPVPEGWGVEITPAEIVLAPGEEIDVAVVFDPPAGFAGRQQFNVNAFDDIGLAGGVTIVVEHS